MAVHLGSEGTARIGTDIIAEVTNWSIEETGETIDISKLGDTARGFKTGLSGWTGSVEAHYDETDSTGQQAMTIGTEVNLRVYPESAGTPASGDTYFDGQGLVTGINRSASLDGVTAVSFNLQGTGALTETTVV